MSPARSRSPAHPPAPQQLDDRGLLRGCDALQAEAITSPAMPLCIIAGAGAGKTRVLTRRIAWRIAAGTAASAHVLALTFTRKAAGELRGRLAGLGAAHGVVAGTFHAVALAQLRQLAADRGYAPPVLLDSKARLLAELLDPDKRRARRTEGRRSPALGAALISGIASEIEWAKARLVPPVSYAEAAATAGRRAPVGYEQTADLYERYERERRRRGLCDFEDLLTMLTRLIATDPDVAASQRWRFRHLFVDEIQDTNAAQLQLLAAWVGDRPDLCLVGDPDQAIYAWNGADPDIMGTLARRWPALTVIRLDANYRSTPQVLALAGAALGAAPAQKTRRLPPATRPDGVVPTISSYADEVAEAAAVAAALRRAHSPGRRWNQLAVLARTNAQLVAIEEACAAARVPCRIGRPASFLQHPAVRAVLARASGPEGASPRGFRALGGDLRAAANAAGTERGAPELAALASLCADYQALDPEGSGAGFAAFLHSSLRAEPGPGSADAVELTTFHRAKGLEWPVVFVTGLERGLVPIAQAVEPEAAAEERRLLYVALTRAEDELHCSWARERRVGRSVMRREPSPWLPAIEAARRDLLDLCSPQAALGHTRAIRASLAGDRRGAGATGEARGGDHRAAAAARASLGTGGTPGAGAEPSEDGLAALLRQWRAGAAKAANVPAYVVMPDRTLDALARARPRTTADLLGLPGIGPSRAAAYGHLLLELVRAADPDPDPDPDPAPAPAPAPAPVPAPAPAQANSPPGPARRTDR